MSVFSNRIELNRKLKLREIEIQKLREDKEGQLEEIADLKKQVTEFTNENRKYEKKYVHTGLECEFCYTTLQKEFAFCPKCGKKIDKSHKIETKATVSNIFGTENDMDGLLINQYNGFSDKKVVIPSSIDGRPVIGIWNGVFENCTELQEVVFEEGCKYIGEDVFKGCSNLKKVRLPKSLLEIGDGAFCNCAIEEIAIPPYVKVIGGRAFFNSSLKKILLPDDFKYISSSMLANTLIEEIQLPPSIIHIDYSAFSGTKIKKIELPHNLYSINQYAFEISELKEITIHSNVKIIEKDIFGDAEKPLIHCAAGSKGHLFARKYGVACSEIPPQPVANVQRCVYTIIIELDSMPLREKIADWYSYIGVNKAETWSWYSRKARVLEIRKYMDMEEALRLKRKFLEFVNSHSNWSPQGIYCTLKEITLCECGGYSAV